MKKSNIIISGIALTILGVVVTCLAAFKQRPEWEAEKKLQQTQVVDQKAIEKMTAFATKCSLVEELVLESSLNLRGQVTVTDSSQFKSSGNGEMKMDTILENGGKKLTIRIEPEANGQIIYYDIQLLLPIVKTISVNNVNLVLKTKMRGISISLKGESLCHMNGTAEPGTRVALTDLSSLYCIPRNTDSVQINASGNAIVNTDREISQLMLQKGKLVLTQNAIVRDL